MTWVAVGIAGASLVSGVLGNEAADDASRASQRGNAAAIAEQQRQFDISMGLLQPQMVTGTGAFNKIARLLGIPYQEYKAPQYGQGGSGGGVSKSVGRSGLGDPLGLPDPLGIFGSAGREATWGPGTGQTLTTKQVRKMLKQGMSIDDITKLGRLETSLNPHRTKKLMKKGLDAGEIQRLQQTGAYGPGGVTIDNETGGIITPDGPDLGEFTESPDYQFRLREGNAAIDRSAAARGGALSGNAVRANTEYGSELASTEYGNFFERLMRVAGLGGAATNQAVGATANTGTNVSNLLTQQGQARASGILGQANSIGGAVNTGLNAWLLSRGGYFSPAGAG